MTTAVFLVFLISACIGFLIGAFIGAAITCEKEIKLYYAELRGSHNE